MLVFIHVLYAIGFIIDFTEGFLNIEELQEMRYSLDISQNPINLAEVYVESFCVFFCSSIANMVVI